MGYQEVLGLLAQFNLYAWIIAAIASFMVYRYTRNKGWAVVMVGSLFVVLRQLWKFIPGYKPGQESELLFNAYMTRFVFGAIGASILCAGLLMIIVNYYVLKAKLEDA